MRFEREKGLANMHSSIIAFVLSSAIICVGCESKPVEPEYSGPATSSPMSAEKHARMVLALKKHVAKYYKNIPFYVSYDDLGKLPRLRQFLQKLTFVYEAKSRWQFTKKALAQASDVGTDWISLPIAHGTYDHVAIVQYEGSTGSISADHWSVGYYVKSSPSTQLGRLFAASHLLTCRNDGYSDQMLVWGTDGAITYDTAWVYDKDLTIAYEDDDVAELNCPETREH